jgi:uncharacterized membrane-anchored protein YhcB (DUF1043 family)
MSSQLSDPSNMDQVRELLMGNMLKDLTSRSQRQEEQFKQAIADLADSLKNRVESLEKFMKSESASLLHRLQEEQGERRAALKNEQKERLDAIKAEQTERSESLAQLAKELAKEVAAKEEALERKLATLSSTLDTAELALRQLMLSETARLSDKLDERYKEALKTLTTTAQQIRDDVVSRSSLSAIFAEAAVRFSGQPSEILPGDAAAQPAGGKTVPAQPAGKDAKTKPSGS